MLLALNNLASLVVKHHEDASGNPAIVEVADQHCWVVYANHVELVRLVQCFVVKDVVEDSLVGMLKSLLVWRAWE